MAPIAALTWQENTGSVCHLVCIPFLLRQANTNIDKQTPLSIDTPVGMSCTRLRSLAGDVLAAEIQPHPTFCLLSVTYLQLLIPMRVRCLQIDEADYDARLTAYQQLQPGLWAQLPPWQGAPLAHAALADLRNADDIALRHAAAQVGV